MRRVASYIVLVVLATACGFQQAAGAPFSLSSDEFPLIMTGLGSRAYIPSIVTELKCDYVHIYVMATSTNEADMARDHLFFDTARDNGVKVLAYLRCCGDTGWVTKPNGLEQLRTIVKEFRNRSALGFWYMFDEPDNHGVSPAVVQQYYQMVKAESPGVPVANCHAWSANWRDYDDGEDILMNDNYPVSDEPFPDAPIDHMMNFTLQAINQGEPVIPVLQSCRCTWRGEGMRFPNRTELRYWSYGLPAVGVRGLSWFTHGAARDGGDTTWLDGTFEPMLRNLRTFVDAVEPAHEPDLLLDGQGGKYCVLAVWARGSDKWVVLVNNRNYGQTVVLSMYGRIADADLWPCDGTREGDERIRNGSLQSLSVGPWETCVWQAMPLGLPATPENLQATAQSAGRIDLRWTDTADNETMFKIDRRPAGTTVWTRIGAPPANTTLYRDLGDDINPEPLDPNTTYRYKIKANNAIGNGRYSEIASDTTLGGIDARPGAGNDDAEQIVANGGTFTGSLDLDLVQSGGNDQVVGIRFQNVSIPADAYIDWAYLQFTVASPGTVPTDLTLHGQAIDNAPVFTTGTSNISMRATTTASVAWDDVPDWNSAGSSGANRRSPDLAEIIQEIVSRAGWADDNALALIISGTGERSAISYDADPSGAPLLHVHYSMGLPIMPTNTQATAKSAGRIDVTWADTSTNEALYKIDRRLAGHTNWIRAGNAAINTTIFRDVGDADERLFPNTAYIYRVKAYNALGNGPYGDEASATTLTGVDGRPHVGTDDSEEIVATGSSQTGSFDLDLVNSGGYDQVVGIRFPDLKIPIGAVIDTATLQFTAKDTASGATALILHGQATDDASSFDESYDDISARPLTAQSVAWDAVPAWNSVGECGPAQRAPDLAGIVQEIVSRQGWVGGNALALIISGTGAREAFSYNGSDGGAPFLHVQYSFPECFVAYNDMMWAASDRTDNITRYTGWAENGLTTSGPLVDYLTGSNLAVTLSIADPGIYNEAYRGQGGDAGLGTDAHTEFSGIVDCLGVLPGDNDGVWTFAGLDSDSIYELAVFGNRHNPDYDTNGQNRTTEYVLSGVNGFVNDSTLGAEVLTTTMADDTTRYCTGYNTNRGYVARWTNIRPGGSTMTLTVQGSNHYVNAMKLEGWPRNPYVPPSVQFCQASSQNAEGVVAPTIEVCLSHETVFVATVAYAASSGTATNPGDYTLALGTLTFLPSVTNLTVTPSIVNEAMDENNETFTIVLSDTNDYCTLGSPATHAYTIVNDDNPPSVRFSASTYTKTAPESGSQTITVQLSAASGKTVQIGYQTAPGTATAGSDYTTTSGTLIFAPGDVSKTFSVPILPDSLDEANETVALSLLNRVNCQEGTPYSATLTITDDDNQPTVQFSASAYTKLTPESGSQTITVQLSAASGRTVQIGYQTAPGTATAGSDYTATSGTLVFPPGDVSETFAVPILPDSLDEANETVALSLLNRVNCQEGTPYSATLTINDDDNQPTVAFSASAYTKLTPESGSQTITVQLSAASGRTVQIGYQTAPGTAAAGGDYTTTAGTLVFAPGDVSETFAVAILPDSLDEANETVALSLLNRVNCQEGTPYSATLTINDDDNPPTAYYRQAAFSKAETAGNKAITVQLSVKSGKTVQVDYQTADGTATNGLDYTVASGTLVFSPDSTQAVFNVPYLEDALDEDNETVLLSLDTYVNCWTGAQDTATLTITDNDNPPYVAFSSANYDRGESGNQLATVQLTVASGKTVTIGYGTADGTATVADNDYAATAGTLTFMPGQTSTDLTVPITPDTRDEPDETINLLLATYVNCWTGAQDTATLTILDVDSAPTVQFRLAASASNENVLAPNLGVFLSQASAFTATVAYTRTGGTASTPADYTLAADTLTFMPGVTNLHITPSIVDDSLDEWNQTILVTLSSPNAHCLLGAVTGHTYSITDNDPAPDSQFSSSAYGTAESGAATITIELSTPSGKNLVTVDYQTADGTATNGSDYTGVSGTVTFSAGETNETFDILITGDTIDENDETVTLSLSNPDRCGLGSPTNATLTITDNDDPPAVQFRQAASENSEALAAPAVEVYLSRESSFVATIDYAASPGTATSPADYTLAGGTLTFQPGTTNLTITPDIVGDDIDESDEDFDIDLSGANAYCTLGAPGTHTVTILDDDNTSVVQFRLGSSQGDESVAAPSFEVTLSLASGGTATVMFAVSGGSATSPDDYTLADGTLTFLPGATNQTITPSVVDDGVYESDETITVELSGANSYCALGAPATHTYTILDDDAPPAVQFRLGSSQNDEDVAPPAVEVYLGQASSFTATVDYAASPGTATSPADYALAGGTLTFEPGTTNRTVTPSIVDDGLDELDEDFDMVLSGPNAYCTLGAPAVHTWTIRDDDAPPVVQFRLVSSQNDESVAGPPVEAYLGRASTFTATVDYAASPGTATSPADYTLAGGTLTFEPGTTNLTVTPSIVDDELVESDEDFDVVLSGPNAYCALGGTATHTCTIQNNDVLPAVSFGGAKTFRVTEYFLTTGDFEQWMTTYDLTLDQDLAADYFILIRGSRTDDGSSSPDNDYARVDAVPGGKGELAASSGANVIRLSRYAADLTWEGVVTVVECLGDKTASGFTLLDIVETSFNDTDTAGTDSSAAWNDIDRVTLFGGYRGGGAEFSEDALRNDNWTDTDACSVFMRLYPSSTGTLNWQRQLAAGATNLESGVMSTFVVEWGAEWTVQRVLVSGSNGGDGADQTAHYTTAPISAVARGNTWVWGTGYREDGGIGDCAEACLVTLGNGVTRNATETSVAVGSEYTDTYSFDVVVMTHSGLRVDHRFKPDGDPNVLDLAIPVDTAGAQRFAWSYNTVDTLTAAFPRSTFWARYTDDAEITLSRGYDGQAFCAWVQGIDLADVTHTPAVWQVAESAGSVTFSVTLRETLGEQVTLDYGAAPITATAGADYTAVSGTLTWGAGESGDRIVVVPILDDGLDESDETFSVDLSGPVNCTILGAHSRTVTIIDDDETATVWTYRKGLGEASAPVSEWRRVAFDDSAWLSGSAPLGYGAAGIATTLDDMQGAYSCVFLRRTFAVPNPALVNRIDVQADYDDGFLLWLNGEEIVRVNVAGTPGDVVSYTTLAQGSASASWSNTLMQAAIPLLFKGANVIAVQVFNEAIADSDLIIDVGIQLLQGSSLSGATDADQDGMADQWETDSIPGGDGEPDADGDGDDALNLDEFVGGTDPDSAPSVFRIKATFVDGEVRVSFPTVEAVGPDYEGQSRYYSLQEKPLQGGTFQTIPGYDAILGTNQMVIYTNVSSTLDKDYRGRVWLE